MDAKAKERMLQDQSSHNFSQSDSNDGGTFARLSTDTRPTSYLPGQFNPSHATAQKQQAQSDYNQQ